MKPMKKHIFGSDLLIFKFVFWNLFLILCLGLSGCKSTSSIQKSFSEEPAAFPLTYSVDDLNDFQSLSQPLDTSGFKSVIPLGFSNEGMVPSTIIDNEGTTWIGFYSSIDQNWSLIKSLESARQEASFYLIAISESYLVFGEFIPHEESILSKIWSYNLEKNLLKEIAHYEGYFMNVAKGIIVDSLLFINFPVKDDFLTYKIDLNQMEEIDLDSPFVDFHCDSPVYVDGFLFYIAIDRDSLETSVWKSDLRGEMREEIRSFSYEEGYVNNLLTWNNKLVWMMIPGPDYSSSQFYKFNALTQEPEIFLEIPGLIDSPKIGGEILTWWSPSDLKGRSHTKYSVYNLLDAQLIPYEESVIIPSDSGILWTRFNLPENEIPKGEIFLKDNSSLMVFHYE